MVETRIWKSGLENRSAKGGRSETHAWWKRRAPSSANALPMSHLAQIYELRSKQKKRKKGETSAKKPRWLCQYIPHWVGGDRQHQTDSPATNGQIDDNSSSGCTSMRPDRDLDACALPSPLPQSWGGISPSSGWELGISSLSPWQGRVQCCIGPAWFWSGGSDFGRLLSDGSSSFALPCAFSRWPFL